MSPAFDSNAFDRATEPVLRLFPVEQARDLAEYRSGEWLQTRVEELAAKSNEGELTEEDRAEYLGYVQANKFVAILQAQARRRLTQGS
jgi:transglutaminase-like putative cysteine protease